MVARARALMGLKEMLPSSFSQMSPRRSGSTGHFSPPARIASLNARQRAETSRPGSPIENRVPSTCRTTPGCSSSVAAYTTQPTARSGASTALTAPAGSTLSRRRPS